MKLRTKSSLLLCALVALFGVVGCSDDEPKNEPGADVAIQEDVGGKDDVSQDVSQQDTALPDDKDVVEPDLDADETGKDVDETKKDVDETGQDTDDSDVVEPDPDVADPDPVLAGDTCADGVDVTAGGTFADQTTTGYSDSNDPNRGPGCAWATTKEDRVYVVTPVLKTKYKVTVTPKDGSLYDPVLYARLDCEADACVAGTNFGKKGAKESITFTVEAAASMFIIVDGDVASVGAATHGDFTLDVEILEEFDAPDPDPEPMVGGETCDVAIDVTTGGSFADQSTVGAGGFYHPGRNENNCPGSNITGPERVYAVTPAVATTYKITVVPEGTYNPMIYVRANCAVESACLGGQRGLGAGRTISTTFTAPAGVASHIIVDGLWEAGAKDAGIYTLNVEILP